MEKIQAIKKRSPEKISESKSSFLERATDLLPRPRLETVAGISVAVGLGLLTTQTRLEAYRCLDTYSKPRVTRVKLGCDDDRKSIEKLANRKVEIGKLEKMRERLAKLTRPDKHRREQVRRIIQLINEIKQDSLGGSAVRSNLQTIREHQPALNPETLIAELCYRESGGDHRATSSAGAHGLCQIMPATARAIGLEQALHYENSNLNVAIYLVTDLMNHNGGRLHLTTGKYNCCATPGRWRRAYLKAKRMGVLDDPSRFFAILRVKTTREYSRDIIRRSYASANFDYLENLPESKYRKALARERKILRFSLKRNRKNRLSYKK